MIPPAPPLTLPVALYDYAGLGSATTPLEKSISRIYNAAGVHIAWQVYHAQHTLHGGMKLVGPSNAPAPAISLRYMAGRAGYSTHGDAMGATPEYSPYPTVFESAVQKDANNEPVGELNALVGAHEMGHALGLTHTRGTVMSPHLNRQTIPEAFAHPWNAKEIAQIRKQIEKLEPPAPKPHD